MALTLANRRIPSSCLSLITLSPRPAALHHRSYAAFNACLDKLHRSKSISQQRLVFPLGSGPDCVQICCSSTTFCSYEGVQASLTTFFCCSRPKHLLRIHEKYGIAVIFSTFPGHLIVLSQEVGLLDAVGDHCHHCRRIFYVPCTQLRNHQAPLPLVQFGAGLLIPSWKQWDSRMDLSAHALRNALTDAWASLPFSRWSLLYCLRRLRLGRWLSAGFPRTGLFRAGILGAGTGSRRSPAGTFCSGAFLVSVSRFSLFGSGCFGAAIGYNRCGVALLVRQALRFHRTVVVLTWAGRCAGRGATLRCRVSLGSSSVVVRPPSRCFCRCLAVGLLAAAAFFAAGFAVPLVLPGGSRCRSWWP